MTEPAVKLDAPVLGMCIGKNLSDDERISPDPALGFARAFGDDHAYVSWDPTERVYEEDIWGPEGSAIIRVCLPVYRVKALVDALRLLDELGELLQVSEHVPTGWEELCAAVEGLLDDHGLKP